MTTECDHVAAALATHYGNTVTPEFLAAADVVIQAQREWAEGQRDSGVREKVAEAIWSEGKNLDVVSWATCPASIQDFWRHKADAAIAAYQEALAETGHVVTRWASVPGNPDYRVSESGDVKSRKFTATRYLNPTLQQGYLNVRLRVDGGYRSFGVHRLVMLAFVGECPEGMEVRHLDGNPLNNALSNLAYGTPSENHDDTVAHGNHHNANKTHCKRGHPYAGDNLVTHVRPNGRKYRACRECKNISARRCYKLAAAREAERNE